MWYIMYSVQTKKFFFFFFSSLEGMVDAKEKVALKE